MDSSSIHEDKQENVAEEYFDKDEPSNQKDKKPKSGFQKLKKIFFILVANAAVITYLTFASLTYIENNNACTKDCQLAFCSPFGLLLFVAGVSYLGFFYTFLKRHLSKPFNQIVVVPLSNQVKKRFSSKLSKTVAVILVVAGIFSYVIFETYSDFTRLRSLIGFTSLIAVGYLCSTNRRKIKWRPVICGAIFQFLLGVLSIRWSVGRAIFECFGSKVAKFLDFSKEGASFVFGDFLVYEKGVFAFAALPTIFFFGLIISVLYYLGTIQWILMRLGWILQSVLGTTVCESVNAAGNIFLGMSESPLIIKPYIKLLTESELHAVMVSGFASVSGTGMALYMLFGADPKHLITASLMAAPASLCYSKLIYPESEESKTSSENIKLEKSKDSSILDAASNGASQVIDLILNMIATLVAFVSFVAFADGILKWATTLVGFNDVGIKFFLGKIFIPVSWAIGIDWEDCEAIGNVIGTKTLINEFVAFELLGEYKKAGTISPRSSAIATFAICGFANPSSTGIMIGALSALAPTRRSSITKVAFRAFISGCFVTLITASIAALLMTDEMIADAGIKDFGVINQINGL